jgi:hypothetical protein
MIKMILNNLVNEKDYKKIEPMFIDTKGNYSDFPEIDNSNDNSDPNPNPNFDPRGPDRMELNLPRPEVKVYDGVAGFTKDGRPILYELVQVDGETETIRVSPGYERPMIFVPGKGLERI